MLNVILNFKICAKQPQCIVGCILQVGYPLMRERTQLKFKLIIIQEHICEEVNRINLKNEKQYNCRKT